MRLSGSIRITVAMSSGSFASSGSETVPSSAARLALTSVSMSNSNVP